MRFGLVNRTITAGDRKGEEAMNNTRDFSEMGYRELDMVGDLLKAYKGNNDETRFLGDGVKSEFNPNSGNVFLVDEDYNVAMMNGDKLEDFFSCPECGHEGFLEEMQHGEDCEGCVEYLESIAK